MKTHNILPSFLLIGAGLIMFIPHWQIPYKEHVFAWPSILFLLGLILLFKSYLGKETYTLFSGWLLVGLGLHFHALRLIEKWPAHWAMFTAIVGISFLLHYSKTKKDGLGFGIMFTCGSLIGFFYTNVMETFQSFSDILARFWPLLLIILGLYLLVKKK